MMAKGLPTAQQAQYALSAMNSGANPIDLVKAQVLTPAVVNSLVNTGSLSLADGNSIKAGIASIITPNKVVKVAKGKALKVSTTSTSKATAKIPAIKMPKAVKITAAKMPKMTTSIKGLKTSSVKVPKSTIKSVSQPSVSLKIAKPSGVNFRLPHQKISTNLQGF
jgi:hypothetical protein